MTPRKDVDSFEKCVGSAPAAMSGRLLFVGSERRAAGFCRNKNTTNRLTPSMNNKTLPKTVSAGTSVVYRRELPYRPADGWSYLLAISIPGFVPATAEADGDAFAVTISAALTATWPAGTYTYSERVSNGTLVHEVGRGTITVEPEIAAVSSDGRSHAQRALAAIEAALEGRLVDGIQNYSIGGRAVSKIPLRELYELREKYRVQVFVERKRSGAGFGVVQVAFNGIN